MQTITELKAWRVAAPDGCALANRDGGHEPYFRRTVVVAKDNQDRIGLAEIPGIQGMDELIQSPRVQAAVVGRPVIHWRSIVDELDGLVGGDESSDRGDKTWDADLGRHLKSGVEVSVGDLLGQREAVPLADLFGKRRRSGLSCERLRVLALRSGRNGYRILAAGGDQGLELLACSASDDCAKAGGTVWCFA